MYYVQSMVRTIVTALVTELIVFGLSLSPDYGLVLCTERRTLQIRPLTFSRLWASFEHHIEVIFIFPVSATVLSA